LRLSKVFTTGILATGVSIKPVIQAVAGSRSFK